MLSRELPRIHAYLNIVTAAQLLLFVIWDSQNHKIIKFGTTSQGHVVQPHFSELPRANCLGL